ncbi:MAG: hypothetical protein GY862_39500 [Gammaproteobacteria bacterium]|nr:hypothetical protein [Gammaproteobacteria bacterium]
MRYSDKSYEEGKKQLARHMDKTGCAEGWLIVFDKRKKPTWDDRIFWRIHEIKDKTIHTVRCYTVNGLILDFRHVRVSGIPCALPKVIPETKSPNLTRAKYILT